MSEILKLEWAWVDLDNRCVEWPDSKTGGMSKPMSAEAIRLLEAAPRLEESPYVCPNIFDPNRPMSKNTYSKGWRRILGRAGLPRIGTHGIRHRSATDIANSGIPVKVAMALTAHKTVTMFMRYVHTEDDPVRAAADAVAVRRQGLIGGAVAAAGTKSAPAPIIGDDIAVSLAENERLPRYRSNEIWRIVSCRLPSLELVRSPMGTPPCCAAMGTTSPCGPPPVSAPRHSPRVRRWWQPAPSWAAFIRASPQAVRTRCRVRRLWWWRCRATDIATCSTPQRRFYAASRWWCSAPR